MKLLYAALVIATLSVCTPSHGQAKPDKAATPAPKSAYFVDLTVLDLGVLLPEPPAVGSPRNNADLAELHRLEQIRTPAQIAAAKADEAEQDIFSYATVLGPGFTPANLPITSAFSANVHNDESVVAAAIKPYFHRPRPYQTDATLHPVCGLTDQPNSYPSGHSLSGYLLAFALIEIVPEKRLEILARADDYAHNRLICGVHHPSDVEASRGVAYAVFGYMLATPRFQRDLAAARDETRARLALAPPQK